MFLRRRLPPMLRAFANRNYRLWALADLISGTGTWMQVLGLNWVVMERTGSATTVGLSVATSTLPILLFSPWAGSLADRVSPRKIIASGEIIHVVIALLLSFLVWQEAPLPLLFVLTGSAGLVGAFEGPAIGRFAGQVVPREDLGNALAWNSITNSTGRVLGMSLAGVLAAAVGEALLFLINGTTFLVVVWAVLAMRGRDFYPLAVSEPEHTGVVSGLSYLRRQTILLALLALGFVLSSLGRNYQVTMAAMAEGPLDAGSAGYGTLSSVFAIGTVLGGLVATRIPEFTLPVLLTAAAGSSLLQAVSGYLPGIFGFGAAILVIAMGAVVIDTANSTRLQLDAAETMRGRVLSIQGALGAGAGALGAPLLGWMSEMLGPQEALLTAGVITLVATGVAGVVMRRGVRARQARLDTDPERDTRDVDTTEGTDTTGPETESAGPLVAT